MPQHMSVGCSFDSLLLKSYFLPYHLTEQWRHHSHHTWQQHLNTLHAAHECRHVVHVGPLQANSGTLTLHRYGLTRIMPMPTGTQRTVEMRAILAVFQAWSCCDRCEGAALLAKLLPKKTASAQPVLLSFRRHRQCYLKSRPPHTTMQCEPGTPLDSTDTREEVRSGHGTVCFGWRHKVMRRLWLTNDQGIEVDDGCDAKLHDGVCYGYPHEPQKVHPPEWRCSSAPPFNLMTFPGSGWNSARAPIGSSHI